MCVFKLAFVFSGYIPRYGISGSCGIYIFHFFKSLHAVSHSGCTSLHSHQAVSDGGSTIIKSHFTDEETEAQIHSSPKSAKQGGGWAGCRLRSDSCLSPWLNSSVHHILLSWQACWEQWKTGTAAPPPNSSSQDEAASSTHVRAGTAVKCCSSLLFDFGHFLASLSLRFPSKQWSSHVIHRFPLWLNLLTPTTFCKATFWSLLS